MGSHQDQRDPNGNQSGESIPVIQRIVQPRAREREELGGFVRRKPGWMQAGQQRENRHDRDPRADCVHRPTQSVGALGDEREREDSGVGRDPPELGNASLGAARPTDSERGPERESPQ